MIGAAAAVASAVIAMLPVHVPAAGVPATGGFVVQCEFSHAGFVDPIIMPGHEGMSHLHEFFGNTGTDENSTGASLLVGSTTCTEPRDRSAYWVPALYQDGVRVPPATMLVSYDVSGPGVTAFPTGFMAVAGRTKQTAVWGCLAPGRRPIAGADIGTPPVCAGRSRLAAQITFPNCWDGTSLDSPDHISHLAFPQPAKGAARVVCPVDHPVPVPRVTVTVIYPAAAKGGSGISLASGDASTIHADIFQAWTGTSLQDMIDRKRP